MEIRQHITAPLKSKCLGKVSGKDVLLMDICFYDQDLRRKEEHQEAQTYFQHCHSIKVPRIEALFDMSLCPVSMVF